jgi:plastocyanin
MRRTTSIAWLVGVTVITIIAAACSSEGASGGTGTEIRVLDYEFDPDSFTVGVGDTVTWAWEGSASHNVVGDGFTSPDQSSGSFRHTFEEPGTYPYACTIHPGMDGTVIVEGGDT